MSAKILDGKKLAAQIRAQIKAEVEAARAGGAPPPGLATILVGEDPASQIYVRNKRRACAEAGIQSSHHALPATIPEADLLALIEKLNADPAVHGILVQLPLPAGIDEERILTAIAPHKDVDGFHPYNVGQLFRGRPTLLPCTPAGILRLIDHAGCELSGRSALVVGRSQIVGLPAARLLIMRHATVTVAHSRTRDLEQRCGDAEVLVAAVGHAEMIRGAWIRPGAVVIDVGINRRAGSKKLFGDVEFAPAAERAAAITPVPGGVGPMTIAMLLENTLRAAGIKG